MMLKALFAAAVLFAGLSPATLAAPAEAQTRTTVTERTVVRTSTPRYRETRRVTTRRYATRRVCTNRYRDGRRIRTCRTVRRYR